MTTTTAAKPFNEQHGTSPKAGTVRIERLLPGPIERVWAYLTESDKRAQWFAAGPMELRKGGGMELSFDNSNLTPHGETTPAEYADHGCGGGSPGRILQCEPPRLLAFTFGGGEEPSEVLFELAPRGNDVLLTLTHSRISDPEMVLGYGSGWHTHLGILIDKMNGRTPKPFWSTHAVLKKEYAEILK
jgi:uncharacterized protein YndB with AHSA1/START domain